MKQHQSEVEQGQRFKFGNNWARFLNVLNDERIAIAEKSLQQMLTIKNLHGKTFLDAGSGSGLFSLAARRLGAKVYSFDYDPQSVACTAELKRRYFSDDAQWVVEEGSVLDKKYLAQLGEFDIVYSWGVLHHTGSMWKALENIVPMVSSEGGKIFISIYNDQGRASKMWRVIKKRYNNLPPSLRWVILYPALLRLWGITTLRDLLKAQPFLTWNNYKKNRGMSPWWDVVDWVGGYPFEVAKPEEIFKFYRDRGFLLKELKTCAGGHGCNEFVFSKK